MAYIDKGELLGSLEKAIKVSNEYRMAVVDSDFINLVNDATVIEDVYEVVRCKECRHYFEGIMRKRCTHPNGLKAPQEFTWCCFAERPERKES